MSAKRDTPLITIGFLALFSGMVSLSLILPTPSFAQFDSKINSDYLSREYDWALFLDTRDVRHYLNYSGTSLYPISRVRVYMRKFPKNLRGIEPAPQSSLYEELWYHKSLPIGQRRHVTPNLVAGTQGAVVLGALDARPQHAVIAANAAIRAIIDFQLKSLTTAALIVPLQEYELVESTLARYGFNERRTPTEGKQLSITLRSYPAGRDQQLFLSR